MGPRLAHTVDHIRFATDEKSCTGRKDLEAALALSEKGRLPHSREGTAWRVWVVDKVVTEPRQEEATIQGQRGFRSR